MRALHPRIQSDLAWERIFREPEAFGRPEPFVYHPFPEASDSVARAYLNVRFLEHLAKSAINRHVFEPRARTSKPKVDGNRCIFILRLADAYKRVFGLGTPATPGKPWLSFLAATLSSCEGRELTLSGAIEAWRTARKWRKQPKDLQHFATSIQCPDSVMES